jgi:ketosteroid isomerase-like protein
MKIRLVVALVGLAIGFAAPAFAQQKDAADPQIRQQIDALTKKWIDAIDNNDAAALAALFTEDAVMVTDTAGPIYGREAIQKVWTDLFKQFHVSNHFSKDDQYSPHIIGTAGNEVWRNAEWSETLQGQNGGPIQLKGYWAGIEVREGDAWKKRMLIWNITPAPAATPSPTTTPSNQ